MRHPSLSIIPSLPGIMRVTAMLLPFCWSPFGWSATLPADLKWESNDTDPVYADPEAKRGGTFRDFMSSFPLTLRKYGPDSNGGFAAYVRETNLPLLSTHPVTRNPIPMLANQWAFGADNKTLYFRINPKARWSDGQPVTADDWVFTLKMMRSKEINDPWYNNYYSTQISEVTKFDDHTLAITSGTEKSREDLLEALPFTPEPSHAIKLTANWVKEYNWKVLPVTGPYQIGELKKGKSVTFDRVKDWWGNDERYFQHRFNPDRIEIKVLRDQNIAWQHFLRGELDTFPLVMPNWWHDKSKTAEFEKGYIERLWFYNQTPQPPMGLYLNTADPLLSNLDVRLGIQHALALDKMIATLLRGDYQRLNTYGSGQGDFTNTDLKARPFDPALAREFFAKAGFTKTGPDGILRNDKGQPLSLSITYTTAEHAQRLTLLREEAKKAGLNLELNLMDASAGFKSMLEKKHQSAWMAWSGGRYPAYWEHFHKVNANKPQTNNIMNIDDDRISALVEQYDKAFDFSKKADLSRQIQQRLYELASFVPAYQVPYTRAGAWRWIRLPKVPATPQSDLLYWPLDGSNSGYSFGGLLWIDEAAKAQTRAAIKGGQTFPPVTITDTTYQQK
ncbi:extracellular solute-binding protein [Aeromonas caviae]|nr:extracellular solute-binding protein [Aeromonas caviae]MCK2070638.1 ABC transporter substrate-binding protein [Aeromonas caviae]MDX7694341.1 extracellular solute-binding protein [Aeromonas caviae]MDY7841340.1 extracellular solute-binding protein [Aeromonas caviae]OEG04701.1 peptide ABC transporter substrate-binding protein [Aeromonas caviae]